MAAKIIFLNEYKKLKAAFEKQDPTIQEFIDYMDLFLSLDEEASDENQDDFGE